MNFTTITLVIGLAIVQPAYSWAKQQPARTSANGAPLQAALPRIRVQLVGFGAAATAEYRVGRYDHPLHVSFDREGAAALPWDADGLSPVLEVSAPGGVDVMGVWPMPSSEAEPLRVRVGGGQPIEVLVVGRVDPGEELSVALEYESSLGYRARVCQSARLGEPVAFDVGEPGDLWVDVFSGRRRWDEQTLGRAHVVVGAGRPAAVTVDVGRRRTYATFEAGAGRRVTEGELWFTVVGEPANLATGGDLDREGRLLVAARDQRDLWLLGVTGRPEEPIVVADVPVSFDTRVGGDVTLALGELVVESEVELVDAVTGAALEGWSFDVFGGETGNCAATLVTGRDGEPALVRWFGRGKPAVQLTLGLVWSPRDPEPLRPGRQRIAVTTRADVTFVVAGELAAGLPQGSVLADLRHVATGLDEAALLAKPGVAHELVPEGRRYRGIPAGAYLVRLAGEETWRGPFEVRGVDPCRVVVGGG